MANILYYSAHDSLEFDDLVLLRTLGHEIFSLGVYIPTSSRKNEFRPELKNSELVLHWQECFPSDGCYYEESNRQHAIVTKEFVRRFDLVIVVHSIHFIINNWDALSTRPTIWRTIGQGIEPFDEWMAPYRAQHLKIVRWSPAEARNPKYIGHDAVIRAYKDPDVYQPWMGQDNGSVLTFSNGFPHRYPKEFAFFLQSVWGRPFHVGGSCNVGVMNALGVLSFEDQLKRYRESGAYCYFQGAGIPYTLNFIEAWMTGIPLLALHRSVDIPGLDFTYDETNDLIEHGSTGFLVKSVDDVRAVLQELFQMPQSIVDLSRRARDRAIDLFGMATISH